MVEVKVRDNDVEQALRRLKKVATREKLYIEMRKSEHYEKPFIKRKLRKQMADKRIRKTEWLRRKELA